MNNRKMSRQILTLTVVVLLVVSAGVSIVKSAAAETQGAAARDLPQWTADGQLILPKNFHHWIYLGSPLTPNALNGGKANFPEYHNVYVAPHAYDAYRKTGSWPEGTIMLKELQLVQAGKAADGSSIESSGRGYFPAGRNGIDISVRDSKRFKDTNGVGFFNFGHHAPPYEKTAAAQGKDKCAFCHVANASNMVFTKFYKPILSAE
jgi:Cytochrome P460